MFLRRWFVCRRLMRKCLWKQLWGNLRRSGRQRGRQNCAMVLRMGSASCSEGSEVGMALQKYQIWGKSLCTSVPARLWVGDVSRRERSFGQDNFLGLRSPRWDSAVSCPQASILAAGGIRPLFQRENEGSTQS